MLLVGQNYSGDNAGLKEKSGSKLPHSKGKFTQAQYTAMRLPCQWQLEAGIKPL